MFGCVGEGTGGEGRGLREVGAASHLVARVPDARLVPQGHGAAGLARDGHSCVHVLRGRGALRLCK